jgi:hypothetical protein
MLAQGTKTLPSFGEAETGLKQSAPKGFSFSKVVDEWTSIDQRVLGLLSRGCCSAKNVTRPTSQRSSSEAGVGPEQSTERVVLTISFCETALCVGGPAG